jgi:UDP-glucose:(heptosyl)LPS alpha-1,3-glucosyltransferase
MFRADNPGVGLASVTVTNQQSEPSASLKLAFCLYKYFPYGGLQRDFIRIAKECQRRGHEIRVYTLVWRGDIPDGFNVVIVPVDALTNHTRYERFFSWVQDALRNNPVDGVIGINKMPGLDVYYAADSCYEEKAQTQRSWLYRLLPRYRHFAKFERAVFAQNCDTEVLMISEAQKPFFEKYYRTPPARTHFLPPGISRDRIAPHNADEIRANKRQELGIATDEHVLLMVGSGFIKKGLNRGLHALKSLPREVRTRTKLFVIGEDNPAPFRRMILALGLRKQVTILSGRDDVAEFLLASDILLHPALDEAAGIILLEAIVAGLPVLATENCGWGHYVTEANVGCLIENPFKQAALNKKLLVMIQSERRQEWKVNAKRFADSANIYSLPQKASEIIERVTLSRCMEKPKTLTLAFCLFKYFPFGGLQRDFLHIAEECQHRGYQIRVYTLLWQGPVPPGFEVIIVPVTAVTNHSRYARYSAWVEHHLMFDPVDGVVGFNKMPGLDVYYAADSCYEEKAQVQRGRLYRSIPRYRHFSRFEKAVFEATAETEILMISEVQKPVFLKYYNTPLARFHLLPPGIGRDRVAPADSGEIRAGLRRELSVAEDEILLLMVGSGFITKGLDRVLLAMHALPEQVKRKTRLIAIGQDAPGAFQRMAARLNLQGQVDILKGRDDIPRFLLAADLLVHPAYVENTGTVILEAIVSGLPVLATDVCGYASHVTDARAGHLVASPFRQGSFNRLLLDMMTSDERESWKENGLSYSRVADIYSMPQRAADFISANIN